MPMWSGCDEEVGDRGGHAKYARSGRTPQSADAKATRMARTLRLNADDATVIAGALAEGNTTTREGFDRRLACWLEYM
jgi:hypothetical protein